MGIIDWFRNKKQAIEGTGNENKVSMHEDPKSNLSASPERLQWKELCRDDVGFAISYPYDWLVEYTSQGLEIHPRNLVTYFDTELGHDVASPGVNISIAEVPSHVNDAVRQFKEVRPQGYEGFKQIKEYPCHLAEGRDPLIYEFQYNAGQIVTTGLSLLVQNGNKMFNVSASAKREDFEESRDLIFQIISSFTLYSMKINQKGVSQHMKTDNFQCSVCGKDLHGGSGGTFIGSYEQASNYMLSKAQYCPHCQKAYCLDCCLISAHQKGKASIFDCPNCGKAFPQ